MNSVHLVPTLRVGTQAVTLCVGFVIVRSKQSPQTATQSVEGRVPTRSVGTTLRPSPLAGIALLLLLLAGCGHDDTYTVPGLTKMLQDSSPSKRCTAVEQLGTYGAEAKPAVPQLTQALKDSDKHVRRGAAYALAAIGPDAESALPALTEALKDQDVDLRVAAVYAIPAVGLTAPAARPALQQALRDRDEEVRQAAAKAIRKLEIAAKYRPNTATPVTEKK